MTHIPETALPVNGLVPVATGANPASAWISPTDHMLYAVVHVTKGNAALTSFRLRKATSAAGAGAADFGKTVPVWANLNTVAGRNLVRQANAEIYALDNAADGRGQIVVFQIDPSKLDTDNGFTHVALQIAAGNAANIASVMYFLAPQRY